MKVFILLLPLPAFIYSGFLLKDYLANHVSYGQCNQAIISYKEKTKSEMAESGYEAGCNNGSHESCAFVQDNRKRYEECLKSALINCRTWAMQYKEEVMSKPKK